MRTLHRLPRRSPAFIRIAHLGGTTCLQHGDIHPLKAGATKVRRRKAGVVLLLKELLGLLCAERAFCNHLLPLKLRLVLALEVGFAGLQVVRGDVREVMASKVVDGEFPEDVVNDGRAHLDGVVALHHAVRLKAREHESLHEFLQRNPVLQA